MFPQKLTSAFSPYEDGESVRNAKIAKYRFWVIMNELQSDRFLKRNLTKFDSNDLTWKEKKLTLTVFLKKYVFMLSHRTKAKSESS